MALAVGLGVTNAGLTLIDALTFSELPYEGGDRFLRIESFASEDGRRVRGARAARFHLLAEQAESLVYLGGKDHEQLNVIYPSGVLETVTGVVISPDAFEVLPARPLLGRTLVAADGEPGAEPVVVIRESVWRSRFGRGSDVIGMTLEIAGTPRTIVGVLPDSFEFPNSPLVWVPLDDRTYGGTPEAMASGIEIFGLRTAASSWELTQAQVTELSRRYEAANPSARELRLRVLPYTEPLDAAAMRAGMAAFMAVLILVLLVIASNVGNLLMVRSASRSTELAVRSALGAGRQRLIAQLLVEVGLLVALAAGLGFAASSVGMSWFRTTLDETPFWIHFSPSPRTAIAAALVALVATVAAGLGPALKATRAASASGLQAGSRGVSGLGLGRFGSTMTVMEMALSVALVGAALVTARGALSSLDPDYGLPEGEILTANLRIQRPDPPAEFVGDVEAWRTESILETRRAALEAIRKLPGVASVGAVSSLPGDNAGLRATVVDGGGEEAPAAARKAPVASVLPGYLKALGARPLAGRLFEARDLAAGAKAVVVVNQPFVEKFLGGRQPIGLRIRIVTEEHHEAASREAAPAWREIVGVVQDLGLRVANPEMAAGFYVPMGPRRSFDLAIRTRGEAMAFAGSLREAVAAVDPEITLRRVQTLEDVSGSQAFSLSLFGGGLVLLGGTALMLALVGMFAITALTVTQRTREIGIRTALGASPRDIVAVVSRRAMALLLIGAAVGGALGALVLLATRTLDTGLSAGEPWEVPGVALALGLAGVLACWFPARRALRISPSEALRAD